MDILSGINLDNVGFVALFTFGFVAAVNFWKPLCSRCNFVLSLLVAFGLGFVPKDLGNIVLNHAKDAISVAVSLNGAYQFLSGVAKKMTNKT